LFDVLTKIRTLNRKDIDKLSIWADIIVWFPYESDFDFSQTYHWINEFKINKLHTFPFSPHKIYETVPAWNFSNQVKQELKLKREKQVIELWNRIEQEFITSQKWKSFKVLLEENKWWIWNGWTENYINVSMKWKYNRWEIVDYIMC
jgi:threonylcarbamoyladenosine tRNA methylthiotransferase MtaB